MGAEARRCRQLIVATRPVGSCSTPGCVEHYACRLRDKGLQVSPRATPTTTLNMKPTPGKPPAYNREIIYNERPGGTKIPLLNPDGSVVRRRQYDREKAQITSTIRRIRNSSPGG